MNMNSGLVVCKIERAILENSEIINLCNINTTVLGKHVSLLNDVSTANYERAVTCDVAKRFFSLVEFADGENSTSLHAALVNAVKSFTSAAADEEETVLKQLVIFGLGVSCLQLYMQNNWVGPPSCTDPHSLLPSCCQSLLQDDLIHKQLCVDTDGVYQLSHHPLYLLLSKLLLISCREFLGDLQSLELWQMRTLKAQQALIDERSSSLKSEMLDLVTSLKSKTMFSGATRCGSRIAVEFHLEAGHLLYFYYESGMAQDHFDTAVKLSGLNIHLTGILGRRTRFQQKDISQLVLQVTAAIESEKSDVMADCNVEECTPVKVDQDLLPKNVRLDDEAVLESINVTEPGELTSMPLTATQQALLLALCHHYRKSHESDGQAGIVHEELMAYVSRVLAEPRSWSVQTAALLLRSRWEKDSARRMQRSLSQLEEIVNQFARRNVPASVRISHVHCVPLPPRWTTEQALGQLLDDIGAVGSALEVYLRLQSWENVIACYAKLGHQQKAEKLIREQLAKSETATLLCYLGDVTGDVQHYHRAWQVSGQRSARSQRSLAYFHFNRAQLRESLQYFDKSLRLSPLQVGVWFTYGCAALDCEEFNLAATAFRRCVNLDNDNFAAWSNLATAYIKAGNKPRAYVTYQEALKCDFENWRIWENFLAVAVDVGEFAEAIKAYHRLLELRNKYTDIPVLSVLVHAVTENIADAHGDTASYLQPKLLELFGHITAKVTNSADIWHLYAELLANSEQLTATLHEKVVQYYRTALSCATLTAGWEKDPTKCTDVISMARRLSDACIEFIQKLSDAEHIVRVKSSARLAVKGVVAKIRREHSDGLASVRLPDFADSLQELEQILLQFSSDSVQNMTPAE